MEGSARYSGLDELVDDGPREEPRRGNRRVEVATAPILKPKAVHLSETGDGLAGPAVDVSPLVWHVEAIPDDLLHVVGIRDRDDPEAAGTQHAVDLTGRVVGGRGVLEYLDHEYVVERPVRERKPGRDV